MKNKIWILILALTLLLGLLPAYATEDESNRRGPLLVDDAGLLSSSEHTAILNDLERISAAQKLDVVIVTVEDIGSKSPGAFADDYYDYNYYGQGSNHDGLLLLISMQDSDWYISTCGYGITAFTDAGIEYIGEQIVPYMSEDDFASAFRRYAELCEEFVIQARSGDPYDSHNLPKEPFDFVMAGGIALVLGLIIASIYTSGLKGQLKTVRPQNRASAYVRDGSLNLTAQNDFFLYRNVTRVRRETESSSGGSSTHTSSSGRSHGGGGGKF